MVISNHITGVYSTAPDCLCLYGAGDRCNIGKSCKASVTSEGSSPQKEKNMF